jgi:uncharacterized OB-fold protein
MTTGLDVADWTQGSAALAYQHCPDCARTWYFRRGFCPYCGSERAETREASGRGTVYAATLVTRAPSEALRALAPYRILLVDADEGFRLMAHGAPDLAIGDAVKARFRDFGPLLIPYFEARSSMP